MKSIDTLHLPHIDATLRFQARLNQARPSGSPLKPGPVITISREFGCEGVATAAALQLLLETDTHPWLAYSRELHDRLASGLDPFNELHELLDDRSRDAIEELVDHLFANKPTDYVRFKTLARNIHVLGALGHAIIVGSAGAMILHDRDNAFHVRIVGSESFRATRISQATGVSIEEAREVIGKQNENRVAFVQKFMHGDIRDPHHYDLVVNNDRFKADEMAHIISYALKQRGLS
jgi:hypothetical protein